MSLKRGLVAAAGVAAALALAACGAGAGAGLPQSVLLRVTAGFGSVPIASRQVAHPPAGWTVMQLTETGNTVRTADGGGFVDAIDGHANDDSTATKRDWFFYVNGIQASVGAASTKLHAGDRVWWDLHDWQSAESIPAVVGSFPEPFTSGVRTVVVCAGGAVTAACGEVRAALKRAGATLSAPSARSRRPFIQVLVGTAAQEKLGEPGKLLFDAPSQSGVYARFRRGGSELELENPAGLSETEYTDGGGLIAAVIPGGYSLPTWIITGTDATGVAAAAGDLSAAKLADHFAVAVSDTSVLAVPEAPRS